MEQNTRRLTLKVVTKDRNVLEVLKGMAEYRPAKDEFSLGSLEALADDLAKKKAARLRKEGEAKAARDSEVVAEHAFHHAILGAKDQVRAQFGDSSNELQSIGLKKKTERKAPKRKTAKK